MGNKFFELETCISSFTPVNETIHHHNHVVLPVLLKWLVLVKKGN